MLHVHYRLTAELPYRLTSGFMVYQISKYYSLRAYDDISYYIDIPWSTMNEASMKWSITHVG